MNIMSLTAPSHPLLKPGGNLREETVTYVHHWTDTLFTFRTTRDPSFRFINGQFAMIGLIVDNKPLLRAYSMVSANYEEHLEFLSIKVPDGPLTSRLQHIKVGERIIVGRKATGTLLQDNLMPGKTLYLLSTGTGLAPFMSVIKDPDAYERFEKIVLVHGVRTVGELAYEDFILNELPANEFFEASCWALWRLRYGAVTWHFPGRASRPVCMPGISLSFAMASRDW